MSHAPRLSAASVRPLPDLADDPGGADLEPLSWLDAVVDGARVVAVGESAHFNAESYRLRHLVLRYLVERHGFTAYAMESGFAEGLRADAWLARGAGAAPGGIGDVLANDMTSLMGMCVEQRRLLEWLRATRDGSGTRFYGVDTPGSNLSLLPALDVVSAYLADADPGLRIDPELRELAATGAVPSVFAAQETAAYTALPAARKDALTAGLSLLLARLRARRPAHGPSAPAPGFDQAERALETAIALDAYRRDMTVNVRDLAQADTVGWILRRERRVVLAAHNAHVQRWPTEFPGVLPSTTTAGQHLGARLGPDYRVIGVTNGTGATLTTGTGFYEGRFFDALPAPPPGTLDAVMAATYDAGPFGVDLHRLTDADRGVLAEVRDQRSGGFICPIAPLTAYDAVIHLPHVTPARPDPDALAAAPPEVATAFRRWTDRKESSTYG